MTGLDELQRFIAGALRRRRDLTSDPELARRAAEYFVSNERLSAVEQLEIYREQFWLRHTSALVEDYPGLSGIVGQRAWERLAEEYLAEVVPSSFSLRDLGQALPAFVRDRALWLEHHGLCVDMARLEWAFVELFDAPHPTRLDPARLAAVGGAWASARIELSPALRLLRLDYPVIELRKRLRTPADEPVAIPERAPACLLLYRSDLRIVHESVVPAAFALLEALGSGASLGEACEAACALGGGAAARVEAEVGAWFADWAAKGLAVDVWASASARV